MALALLASCDVPDPGLAASHLSDLIGDEVLVTTSHPVALSAAGGGHGRQLDYDTAVFLQAKLDAVDPAGIVLEMGERKVWVGRQSIVSVVGAE